MAGYNYGYIVPSSSSESEQDLIKEAFESMETQQTNQPQIAQGQTERYNTFETGTYPHMGVSYLPSQQMNLSYCPASTLTPQTWQYYPFQSNQQYWPGPKVTEETKKMERGTATYPVTNSILNSNNPIDVSTEIENITVLGETGILANKSDIVNWSGPVPLNEYPINEDPTPEVIRKKPEQQLTYTQEIAIRYLRPPTPPPPGDIVIKQEKNFLPPPAPPIVIRQQPPRPETPQPVVIREAPPKPLPKVETKIITIPGKRLPPPPRKVIIERLPPLPSKPQSIIVERWLPFKEQKRKVVFIKPSEPDAFYEKPKNVIIQWESPSVTVNREYKDLGIVTANPEEYVYRYRDSLKRSDELPDFVRKLRPQGVTLASDLPVFSRYSLEGDLFALSLIDLDREGLSEYKNFVTQATSQLQPFQEVYQQPTQYQPCEHINAPYQPLLPVVMPYQHVSSQLYLPPVSTDNRSFINSILDEAINSVQLKTKEKIEFKEAKNVIRFLNVRLNRKHDDTRTERFLESIHLTRGRNVDLQVLKNALLRNLQFVSILMF